MTLLLFPCPVQFVRAYHALHISDATSIDHTRVCRCACNTTFLRNER